MNKWLILLLLAGGVAILAQCGEEEKEQTTDDKPKYKNLSDTVGYVGIETCRSCHSDVHKTFIHTGMGQSFGRADTSKSIAQLSDTSEIYDPYLDFYYHPFWRNDSLYLQEYRLSGKDTTHNLEKHIDYVVGSGQHTNSHIYEINDYYFQAPFTWYAQEGKLDLPPGYEEGGNSRFGRAIGLECASCHNAMPTSFVKGSENKFEKELKAINCERCHGPGEAHVQKVTAGNLTDTATEIDYSIVNPGKLSVDKQFEVCQRCHLQGNAVLKPGKSFFDFKPGMELNSVMDVYLPKFSNSNDKFIMASHVDRFKKSKCFVHNKNNFNCISCHNPHVSVRKTQTQKFNKVCQSCHGSGHKQPQCSAPKDTLEMESFNCVKCHMPSSTSIDIPHVTVHDHYIREPEPEKEQDIGEAEFLGLYAINNSDPDLQSKALAYLQQYERFGNRDYYLDSARYFLQKLPGPAFEYKKLWVHFYHLRGATQQLTSFVRKYGTDSLLQDLSKKTYDNQDAWTAYRLGEAFAAQNKTATALRFYKRAVKLAPFVMDFRNKYAGTLFKNQQLARAREQYEFIISELPTHQEALNNLGYIYLRGGKLEEAAGLFEQAIAQNPDYEMAWLNKANLAAMQGRKEQARKALKEVLRINPDNRKAKAALQSLKQNL